MNIMTMLRFKNRFLGALLPDLVAKQNANMFLTPRKHKLKDWEYAAEQEGTRIAITDELSAIRWGESDRRILMMHGWEGRATQMYGLAQSLVKEGFEVIALDAPMHGHSKGERSNPVLFSDAICEANKVLGPFYGAVGHSMGASALALAFEAGADLGRYVLVSSPACIHDVLRGFASFMGLNVSISHKFVEKIEQEVGRPAKHIDVGGLLKNHTKEKLLIHAKDDLEIPHHSIFRIRDQLSNVRSFSPDGLGHRKIMRDKEVTSKITNFMSYQVTDRITKISSRMG